MKFTMTKENAEEEATTNGRVKLDYQGLPKITAQHTDTPTSQVTEEKAN